MSISPKTICWTKFSERSLIQFDDGSFVSAHYDLSIINFFDAVRKNATTLKNIKWNDESTNCMCIISAGMNANQNEGNNNDKVLVIGGIQRVHFVSIKYQVFIYKLFLLIILILEIY